MSHYSRIFILFSVLIGFTDFEARAEKVVLTEIEAHDLTDNIDPRLGTQIVKKLKKAPFKYTSYRYLNQHTFLVSESKFIEQVHEKTQLNQGFVLQMRSFHEGDSLKLDFKIEKDGKTVFGPIKIKPGSSPTLVGPCKLERGDLMLMIMLAK